MRVESAHEWLVRACICVSAWDVVEVVAIVLVCHNVIRACASASEDIIECKSKLTCLLLSHSVLLIPCVNRQATRHDTMGRLAQASC